MTDPSTTLTVRPETDGDAPPDAVVVGVTAAGPIGLPDAAPGSLVELLRERGEVRSGLGAVAHVHGPDGVRWILVGLGDDGPRHDEDRRTAYGAAVRRAWDLRSTTVRVVVDAPEGAPAAAEAIVLATHRPARIRGTAGAVGVAAGTGAPATMTAVTALDDPTTDDPIAPDDAAGRMVLVAAPDGPLGDVVAARVADAVLVARAQNEARRLQQLPANHLTPRALAREASALGREIEGLRVTTEIGRGALQGRGMGLFDAVARGSDEPPALIVAEWDPSAVDPDAEVGGPVLGLVGKAVTHDTGGYSLKTPAGMIRMKLDMSG
ncbi:MAG: M17 family peptidase N-terminal domain-containing protein, partial [Solirubrobacteraceae bacterium]